MVSPRRMNRLAARKQAECGFRIVDGHQPGLTARWRHGLATLMKGEVLFRPYIPPGFRIPRPFTQAVRIPIVSVGRAGRQPSGREIWWVNARAEVFILHTERARLEWAVHTAQRDWALGAVL